MSPTLYCPTCGYNLTGLPENRCPECGEAFALDELTRGCTSVHPFTMRAKTLHVLAVPVTVAFIIFLSVTTIGFTPGLALVVLGGASPVTFLLAVSYANRMAGQLRPEMNRSPTIWEGRVFWGLMFMWAVMWQVLCTFLGIILLAVFVGIVF